MKFVGKCERCGGVYEVENNRLARHFRGQGFKRYICTGSGEIFMIPPESRLQRVTSFTSLMAKEVA